MRTLAWLRVFSWILLFQTLLIITSTSLSLYTLKDKIQDDGHLLETEEEKNELKPLEKETVGEARWMASYIFPIFPQFYNLDYNSVWNFLKRSDTIGYFVVRDIISYMGLMTFWILLGTALWDGPKSDDNEFGFPLSLIAKLFMPGRDIEAKTGLSKEYFEGIDYKESQPSAEDRIRYPHGYLSEISINGLYNFLTKPKTAAGNLFLSAGFSTFGMLIWFLPTFLWTGQPLDETDRPFEFLTFQPKVGNDFKRREGEEEDLEVEDRLSSIYSAITVESSFAKVYNRLFCPQCIARLAVIGGIGLTGKMIFWTFISLLPREDFDPWFFRPFESFWKSKGFDSGLGPLSSIQREPDFNTTTPQFHHRNFQTTFEKRSQDNPTVIFAENFFSDLLKNIEESIELVNEGIM